MRSFNPSWQAALAGFAATAFLLAWTESSAQNLLANRTFDNATAAPWQVVEPGVAAWNDLDYDADDSSGSIVLTHASGSSGRARGMIQCIPITRRTHAMVLGFSGFVESGQPDGSLGITVYLIPPGEPCGLAQRYVGRLDTTATGVWQIVQKTLSLSRTLLAGEVIGVMLEVNKTDSAGMFGGFIDNVVLDDVSIFNDDFDPFLVPLDGLSAPVN